MDITQKIDDLGKPAWIGLLVLSFIVWWPAGLALLAFLIWSGRMGCGRHEFKHQGRHWRGKMRDSVGRWHYAPSSGNRAFDEYRAEAIRKLEDEQREFHDFLERLRHAKDKQEFDEFMSERTRRRDEGPAAEAQG